MVVADVVVREAEAVADGDHLDHHLVDRRDLMRLAKVCGLGPPIARYTQGEIFLLRLAMLRHASLLAIVLWLVAGLGRPAIAQEQDEGFVEVAAGELAQQAPPPEYGPPPANAAETEPAPPPIPPNVEGAAFSVPGGGYCYYGPHPVDTEVSVGEPWDDTPGAHMHAYPPLDLRLFELKEGCYYFVGDPRDFGYAGPTYSYYGAHPILDVYGGGWCFMIGPHTHPWRPWSPYFTLVGPWYYWEGPYDPFFWSYWPYYAFYYRNYYPHYYVGGRFYHGGHGVAPPIHRVPPPSQVGAPAGGWQAGRGSPSAPRSSAAAAAPYRPATSAAAAVPYRPAAPAAPAVLSRPTGTAAPAAPAASYRPSAPAAPAARSFGGGGTGRSSGGGRRR